MPSFPPGVSIETAALTDIDLLVDQWVALARGQRAHGSRLSPEGNRTVVREALARHVVAGGVLVARDNSDDVVGFVMFGPEQGDYEQAVTRGVVHNLFVLPDHRSRGLGSRLLERAETALAEQGADVVSLEAMAANEDARRFYERHGYHVHRVELEKPARSDTHSKEDE